MGSNPGQVKHWVRSISVLVILVPKISNVAIIWPRHIVYRLLWHYKYWMTLLYGNLWHTERCESALEFLEHIHHFDNHRPVDDPLCWLTVPKYSTKMDQSSWGFLRKPSRHPPPPNSKPCRKGWLISRLVSRVSVTTMLTYPWKCTVLHHYCWSYVSYFMDRRNLMQWIFVWANTWPLHLGH